MSDKRREKRDCPYGCPGGHWGFEMKRCPRRAEATRTRLEHDAPGVVRFGDQTPSYNAQGGTLFLASPHPRPSLIRTPDDWNIHDEPPSAA